MKTNLVLLAAVCIAACSKSNSNSSSSARILFANGCVGATSTSLAANIATLSNTQLNGGKIYTLLYSGNSTQTVGFKLTVINNN